MADDEKPNKTDNNKKRVLDCLEESKGIISTACQNANVSRSQFYEWQNTDLEFKAAVEAVNESAIDHVESKLMEKIDGITLSKKGPDGEDVYHLPPSDTAIIFFLKCRAKKRGYVERTEVDHSGGVFINMKPAGGCDPMEDETK